VIDRGGLAEIAGWRTFTQFEGFTLWLGKA